LSWREGTVYVQYWDGYERIKLEEFLLDSTGSDYCPGANCFEGLCTTAILKKRNVYVLSLMIEVPDHVYVLFCFLTASMSISAILVTRCAFNTIL
jgi:hypothetical protein